MCSSSCPSPTFSLERSPRCLLKKWVPKSRGIKWSEEWRDCRSRLHQIHILPSMNCQSRLFLSFLSFLFSFTLDELSIKTFICLLFLEQHIRKSGLSLHKLLIPTVKRLQPKQSKLIGKIWWLSFLPAAIQNLIPSPCHLCCSMKKPKAAVWPSCTWEQMLKLLESSYKYYLCIYLSILTNINANTVWPSYTWESHC